MKLTVSTSLFTAVAATAAHADPGHIEAAGHGHSHWPAYAIAAGVAAVLAGLWLARRSIGQAARRA